MKIICIGRNYTDHISELKNQKPQDPVVFLKPDSAVLPKEQAFYIPAFSSCVHYEAELLVKINSVGKHIAPKFAHKYYDSIGLGIDFTARDLQQQLKENGLPWEKAKGFDGSAVISPFIEKSKFQDLQNITFSLEKNDVLVQKGNTKDMLWQIDQLIAYVSTFFMLKKGDIIFTGTPAGVGPVAPGDILKGYIEQQQLIQLAIK